MRAILADADCWNNGTIPQLRRLQRDASDSIDAELKDTRFEAKAELDTFADNFRMQDYATASDEAKAQADALFEQCASSIASSGQIQVVRTLVDRFKKEQTARLYDIVAPAVATPPVDSDDPPIEPVPPTTTTVMFSDVAVPSAFKGRVLATQEDVRAFVEALATQLNEQVRNNSKIIL
jgi:hypothetical protein